MRVVWGMLRARLHALEPLVLCLWLCACSFGADQVLFSGWCTDGRLRLADVNADGTADVWAA